jgi:DDE family transposase
LRKQTPEPVFGIIKAVLGFRQFSLRGLDKVRGEWSLVTIARKKNASVWRVAGCARAHCRAI